MSTEPMQLAQRAVSSRRRDLMELLLGYALVVVTCWVPNPLQRFLFWASFAVIAAILLARRNDWKSMGFGLRGSLRCWWVLALTLAFSAVTLRAATALGTIHELYGNKPVRVHVWGYLVWAMLQQIILQDLVLVRLLRLLRSRRMAVAVAAGMFAAAHLPNPLLTAVTLVWGAAACVLFLRYRGLFTLGLAHGVLGMTVAVAVPNAVHHHMRVGLGYLTYGHTHMRVQPLPPLAKEE